MLLVDELHVAVTRKSTGGMPYHEAILAKALENALQGRVYMISWDQWRGQTRKHLFPIILIVSGLYTGMLPTTSILII